MHPDFPLDYGELVQDFKDKGSRSFEFKKINKKKLKKAFERVSRSRVLMRKGSKFPAQLIFLIYELYKGFLKRIHFRNSDAGAYWSVVYFEAISDFCSTIQGEEIDDEIAKVTFVART